MQTQIRAERKTGKKTVLWLVIIGLCVLLLALAYLFRPLQQVSFAMQQDPDEPTEPVWSEQTLSQVFTADRPVKSVSFKIGTYLETIGQGVLRASIVRTETEETVYTQDFLPDSLYDNNTLVMKASLPEGSYELQLYFDGMDEDRPMCVYTVYEEGAEGYRIDGEEYDESLFLRIVPYIPPAQLQHTFLLIEAFVLGVTLLVLAAMAVMKVRRNSAARKRLILCAVGGMLCLLCAAVILFTQFRDMTDAGRTTLLRSNRMLFYTLVLLLMGAVWCFAKDYSEAVLAFVMSITVVLIFADTRFSVIDERAHNNIVEYIVQYLHFPSVYDNYEAVQGPLSYYLTALLTGWLPQNLIAFGGRMVGALLTVVHALILRKIFLEVGKVSSMDSSSAFLNIGWLLFALNPLILIRFTRVSNEPLMCVFSALAIYEAVRILIRGYDRWGLLRCTVFCALAFLTKSTSVFLFGIVFFVCVYYRQWKTFFLHVLLYAAMLAPWFISNYMIYGELTAMQGHLDFVLPLVNPDMTPPNVWNSLQRYFINYFTVTEAGNWYELALFDQFVSVLCLFLMESALIFGIGKLCGFLRRRLRFDYSDSERKNYVFMTFAAMIAVFLVMHTIQSYMTYNISLDTNRYAVMLNSVFFSLLMISMARVSKKAAALVSVYISGFFSLSWIALICGFIQIVMSYYA